jgi:hypothetical protein
MSHLIGNNTAAEVQKLMAALAKRKLSEHPTVTEDWCRRAEADHALTNQHDDLDSEDMKRREALDAGERATIQRAICQAASLAVDVFVLVKARYPFDDVYYPVARETYLAALVLLLDEALPARFRADTTAMQRKLADRAPAEGGEK